MLGGSHPAGDATRGLLMAAVWLVGMGGGYALGWRPAELHFIVVIGMLSVVISVIGRTRPLAAIVAVGLVAYSPVWSFDAPELRTIPLVLVAYAAARAGAPRRAAIPMLVVVSLGSLLPYIPFGDTDLVEYLRALTLFDPSTRILAAATVVAAYLLGAAARTQAEQLDELRRRNAELVRLRAADQERIAAEERTHIAREIHDVVAHHIAAIVVRAQAAAHLGFRRPADAGSAVGEQRQADLQQTVEGIAVSGQEALAAMRRVVRVLRSDDDVPLARTATSVTSALDEVLDRVRTAGLAVDVDPDPAPADMLSDLPDVVQFALIRIVQESLSNVLLHSRAERASVTLERGAAELIVTITDRGASGPQPRAPFPLTDRDGEGDGVRGMRERVAAVGGTVEAGPVDSGWRVVARLPLAIAGERAGEPAPRLAVTA